VPVCDGVGGMDMLIIVAELAEVEGVRIERSVGRPHLAINSLLKNPILQPVSSSKLRSTSSISSCSS
jgi:hypothetical protein